jgi:formylglycine-generating enzyme required for sulfatase activity
MHTALPRLTLAALLAACSLPALATTSPAAPGTVFRDCTGACPEMVVLPAGSFMMGTPTTNRAARTTKARCTR